MARFDGGAGWEDSVFGFDELQKSFNKALNKYPDKQDALLRSIGRLATNKTKADTPVAKTARRDRGGIVGKLQKSWRLQPPKTFGDARVVRVVSYVPYAHLVELGHRIAIGGKLSGARMHKGIKGKHRKKGEIKQARSTGDVGRKDYNELQLAALGRRNGGFVEGRHMLSNTMAEVAKKFNGDVKKLFDELVGDLEL